ncbi:MAG: hypothetical protein V1858_01505 [Candidatus Gottesmanbacteria bacterium]
MVVITEWGHICERDGQTRTFTLPVGEKPVCPKCGVVSPEPIKENVFMSKLPSTPAVTETTDQK